MKTKLLLLFICLTLTVSLIYGASQTKSHAKTYGIVAGDNVNLRVHGNRSAKIITILKRGTIVSILKTANFWCQIQLKDGRVGWVYYHYIKLKPETRVASRSRFPVQMPEITTFAKSFMGTIYVYGGASPSGFDCSGFTLYVYENFGLALPHQADLQMAVGTEVPAIEELTPGDLVFFKTLGSTIVNHVGIYLDDGKFIHASSGKGSVTISRLDTGYYRDCYQGARRVKDLLPQNPVK